jgi:hypothetical protein
MSLLLTLQTSSKTRVWFSLITLFILLYELDIGRTFEQPQTG